MIHDAHIGMMYSQFFRAASGALGRRDLYAEAPFGSGWCYRLRFWHLFVSLWLIPPEHNPLYHLTACNLSGKKMIPAFVTS